MITTECVTGNLQHGKGVEEIQRRRGKKWNKAKCRVRVKILVLETLLTFDGWFFMLTRSFFITFEIAVWFVAKSVCRRGEREREGERETTPPGKKECV